MSEEKKPQLKVFTKKEIFDLVQMVVHSAEHDWKLDQSNPDDGAKLFIALGVVRDEIKACLNIQGETFRPPTQGSKEQPN